MSKRAELTPGERVLPALEHRKTDRAPVEFPVTPEAWVKLRRHLGIQDSEGVLCHLGVGLRHPRRPYVGPQLPIYPDGSWTDARGVYRRPLSHLEVVYDEIIEHPPAGIRDAGEPSNHSWPQPEWSDAEAPAHFNQFLLILYIGDGLPIDQTMRVDDLPAAMGNPAPSTRLSGSDSRKRRILP